MSSQVEDKSKEVINASPDKAEAKENKEIVMRDLTHEEEELLKKQAKAEYEAAYKFLKPFFDKKDLQLKLYNNQKRDPDAVGEPLLFTLHDTLLASLYDDTMTVKFAAREQGDERTEEALNLLAGFDFEEMGKPDIDYDVRWDALFYSYGLIDMTEFSIEDKMPVPYVIDPGTFFYDPRAKSVDGDGKGRGAMRFCGQEIFLTKQQLKEQSVYKNIDDLDPDLANNKSEAQQRHVARTDAMGMEPIRTEDEGDFGENKAVRLIEWRTWFGGKRVLVTFAEDFKKIVRYDEEILGDSWRIIAYHAWRNSKTFIGTSVCDLAEDKQRAIAILINIFLRGLKSDLEPDTVVNGAIVNKAELQKPGGRKIIEVQGQGNVRDAVAPLLKSQPNLQSLSFIADYLNSSAQRATATPELQQGAVSSQQRTLGELQIIDQKVDTRYSKLVKNLMRGEKQFWRAWYSLYKKYLPDQVVEKILRLDTVTSDRFRKLTKENIIGKEDPDVFIESRLLNEAANIRKLGKWIQVWGLIVKDPTADKRFALRKIMEVAGLSDDDINGMLPATIDELMSLSENQMLNENKVVPVRKTDNHAVHLQGHKQANQTKAAFAHIQTHKQAMLLAQTNPELMPQQQVAMQQQGLQPGQMNNAEPVQAGQQEAVNSMMTTTPSMQ